MKHVHTIILILLPFALLAQKPQWKAKFIAHHPISGISDTVWVGLDVNGDLGYQPGLDEIDTSEFNKPVHIRIGDPVIKSQFNTDCSNLRTSIQGFNNVIEWTVYVFSDTFPDYKPFDDTTYAVFITWDTTQFTYTFENHYLRYGVFQNLNGMMNYYIDAQSVGFFYRKTIDDEIIFSEKRIYIVPTGPAWECQYVNNYEIFKFKIRVAFSEPIGLPKLDDNSIILFPNPNNGYFYLNSQNNFKGNLTITDISGKIIHSRYISTENEEITLNVKPGIYIAKITDDAGNYQVNKVIVKP